MRKRSVAAVVVLLAVLLPAAAGQTAQDPAAASLINIADYPRYDGAVVSLLQRGLTNKSITRRLAETPDDPELPRLLFQRQRFDEALTALRLIVQRRPDRIADAFRVSLTTALGDRSANIAAPLLELVAAARARLAALPGNRRPCPTAPR
jgi:hypothetical protein